MGKERERGSQRAFEREQIALSLCSFEGERLSKDVSKKKAATLVLKKSQRKIIFFFSLLFHSFERKKKELALSFCFVSASPSIEHSLLRPLRLPPACQHGRGVEHCRRGHLVRAYFLFFLLLSSSLFFLGSPLKKKKKRFNQPSLPLPLSVFLSLLSAILLPPLAVFLVSGISVTFFVNILLTLLGWIPGAEVEGRREKKAMERKKGDDSSSFFSLFLSLSISSQRSKTTPTKHTQALSTPSG